MKCVIVVILIFLSLCAQTEARSIRYLDLDSVSQKEIWEYSEAVCTQFKKTHGYMRVVLHVNDTGAIDSVSVLENKINNPYPIVDQLRTWRIHSIPNTLLPVSIEYFLDVNHRFKNNADEESDQKRILSGSRFNFSKGYGFNFSVFTFPKYTGSMVRRGVMYEAEILIIRDDSTDADLIFGGGAAMAFLIGNDVNPFSFLFDFKLPIGFGGEIIIAVESDQILLMRIGGGFKVVASIGLFERLFISKGGPSLLVGPRLTAGIEF